MFDLLGRESAPSGAVPDGAAGGGRGRFEADPERVKAYAAAYEAGVQARWAQLVQAELSAEDASRAALLDVGLDPDDPCVVDMEADEDPAVDESVMPAHHPGWVAANASLLAGLPDDESGFADVSPGAELVRALAAAAPEQMSAGQLGHAAAGWERLIAWAQAQQASVVAELTRRPEVQADNPGGRYASLDPVPVTAGDLCTVWPWTKPQAQRMVSWGVDLVERFPAVHEALADGRLDQTRARILTTALGDRDPEVARMVEAAVLPHVHKWTSVKLSQVVNRLLHQIAPQKAKDARREARTQRRVWIEPGKDGMAWLQAYLPAEDAQAIMATLTAAAEELRQRDEVEHRRKDAERRHEREQHRRNDAQTRNGDTQKPDHNDDNSDNNDDGAQDDGAQDDGAQDDEAPRRTLEQARADALAGLAWSSLFTGYLGGDGCATCGSASGVPLTEAHGRPVTVNMTMSLTTWLGLDEHPAELEGYGPIDADTARHLAAAGLWRWALTDPVGGHALDYGRTRYTPPQELVDFILLRDRECIMPGCHRPAYRCEIDHRVPYPEGPTSACNCSAICKTCHLQKHRAGWMIEQLEPGVQRWTSPTGHQRIVKLPRIAPPASDAEPDPEPKPPPGSQPPEPDIPPF